MKVLIAVPKNYGYLAAMALIAGQAACNVEAKTATNGCDCSSTVSRVAESDNLGELVAEKTKIEQDHARYLKQVNELARTKPLAFNEYEGTEEEYKEYRGKLDIEVERQTRELQLSTPCFFNCDLFIL